MPSSFVSFEGFIEATKTRRSIYALGKDALVPDEKLVELVKDIVKNSPSPFNSQTSRVVFLLGDNHEHYWKEIALPSLTAVTPPERQAMVQGRITGFSKARLTILFFESQNAIDELSTKMPAFKVFYDSWSTQSSGMAQINTWNALSVLGYGCNLQHTGSMTISKLQEKFQIDKDWKPFAELVVGSKLGDANEKTFIDDSQRFKVMA